nr:MAG TPA: hypothetical protein [Caudoviricetes sp.]
MLSFSFLPKCFILIFYNSPKLFRTFIKNQFSLALLVLFKVA